MDSSQDPSRASTNNTASSGSLPSPSLENNNNSSIRQRAYHFPSLSQNHLDSSSPVSIPTPQPQTSAEPFGAGAPHSSSSGAASTSRSATDLGELPVASGGMTSSAEGRAGAENTGGITNLDSGVGVGTQSMMLDESADFDVSYDMRLATGEENPLSVLPQDREAWRTIFEDLSTLTGFRGDGGDA